MPKLDLVLLNPPFSCRGGTRVCVLTEVFETSCSVAMAFVLRAFEYLRVGGELIAIIPAGSLTSQKDMNAWFQLRSWSHVEIRERLNHKTFDSYAPSTMLVHIIKCGRKRIPPPTEVVETNANFREPIVIHRGLVQMHQFAAGDHELVHSTELQSNRVMTGSYRTGDAKSAIKGPFVAITRVGSPRKDKVALYLSNRSLVLSDCVVALKARNIRETKILHSVMLNNWDALKGLYGGTGAKYITIAALAEYLASLGYDPKVR